MRPACGGAWRGDEASCDSDVPNRACVSPRICSTETPTPLRRGGEPPADRLGRIEGGRPHRRQQARQRRSARTRVPAKVPRVAVTISQQR